MITEGRCRVGKLCPCAEYAKEMLCDYPFKNVDREIRAIALWGHRVRVAKWPAKVARGN